MNTKLIEAMEKNYCCKCGTSENVRQNLDDEGYRCDDCYTELLERRAVLSNIRATNKVFNEINLIFKKAS